MRIRSLACAALAACAVALAACGGGSSGPKPTETPSVPQPEDVIADWVHQNRNVDFVGDCADARPGIDVGKLCMSIRGERGTRARDRPPRVRRRAGSARRGGRRGLRDGVR